MAKCGSPNVTVNVHGLNVPDWTNEEDSESQRKRSNVICKIIEHRSLDQLRTIVGSGWDINEELYINWVKMPAVYHAAEHRWTDGAKILLEAGAETTIFFELKNPLSLALKDQVCPTDLINLLLEHGVDPNEHDGQMENIPLLNAIGSYNYNENATIIVQHLLEHGANPNVAYQRNVGWCGQINYLSCTALHHAAMQGWTEGVQMLLDAGAKYKRTTGLNALAKAVHNYNCPRDLVELLLKHGVDPNDHDGESGNIPLVAAIRSLSQHDTNIVELLLEHGADPYVTYTAYNRNRKNVPECEQYTVLQAAGRSGWTEVVKMFIGATFVTPGILKDTLILALEHYECPSDLIGMLLKQGVDLNHIMVGDCPLFHHVFQCDSVYYLHPLDAFFLHGGNIDIENADHRTILECVVKQARGFHIHIVRWLIRRGADTSQIRFSWLKEYAMLSSGSNGCCFSQIALILLQAGMRVPHGAQTLLSNMEVAISTWLQEDTRDDEHISRTLQGMWGQLEEAKQEELQKVQSTLRKSTFPEYWTQQMIDLQEFSDESLHVYQEVEYDHTSNTKQIYRNLLDQTRIVLVFLSQPQSLQWSCRHCLRENLESLQPSMVKTLPMPSKLKRYILCHEI